MKKYYIFTNPPILNTFYRGTIESVLTSWITVWYGNCRAADRKTLQQTVNTAAKIIYATLPSILDIFLARCSSKTNSIVKDPTHPSHSLFQLLPSGRRYRGIRAHSTRLLNSFFPPGCESPEPKSPRPPLKPHANPLPPETWTHLTPPPPNTPQPYHTKEKNLYETLCNSKCATHRWVGLYKPPVVTHSPLCALDTFHTLLCVHNHTKDSAIYVCLHAHALQIILHCYPASCWLAMFLFAHVQYLCEAFV